jgi:hypothetical protein
MTDVECTVGGRLVGRGPAGLGINQHSAMHRREFQELTGHEPESYQEVREFFETKGHQPTIQQAALDDEQQALTKIR